MLVRGLLILTACAVPACSASQPRSPSAVESVIDSFVVGPRLGARAAPVARQLRLPFAPHVGYADTGFHAPRGVHGLVLRVDEALASETDHPTRWAQIANIGIGFDTRATADSARQLLARHLGSPFCSFAGDEARRAAWYYWPGADHRGVLLTLPLREYEHPYLVFGAPEPDPRQASQGTCDGL